MMQRLSRNDLPILILLGAMLLALASFAYLGHFTRYMADDYCLDARFHASGFFGSQHWWYTNWTGRYSYIFVMTIAEVLGPPLVPYLSMLALTIWVGVASWSIHQISLMARYSRSLFFSIALGGLIVFATLNGAPNLEQSLYWRSGMLTHTAALLLLTIYPGLVAFGLRRRRSDRPALLLIVLCAVLAFVAGGFSEVYAVTQATLLLLAIFLVFILCGAWLRAALPFMISGLAGSLISLTIMATAPGPRIRRNLYPVLPSFKYLVETTLYYVRGYLIYLIRESPANLVLLFIAPAMLAVLVYRFASPAPPNWNYRKVKVFLVTLPLLTLLLVIVAFGVEVYATTAQPAWRSRFVPQFIISCAISLWSFLGTVTLLSATRRARSVRTASGAIVIAGVCLAVVVSGGAITRNLKLAPHAKANAALWDETDRQIREASARGVRDVTVPAIDDIETSLGAPRDEMQVRRDPEHWINKCVADYYRVESIRTR